MEVNVTILFQSNIYPTLIKKSNASCYVGSLSGGALDDQNPTTLEEMGVLDIY